jgi:hypothetical protein
MVLLRHADRKPGRNSRRSHRSRRGAHARHAALGTDRAGRPCLQQIRRELVTADDHRVADADAALGVPATPVRPARPAGRRDRLRHWFVARDLRPCGHRWPVDQDQLASEDRCRGVLLRRLVVPCARDARLSWAWHRSGRPIAGELEVGDALTAERASNFRSATGAGKQGDAVAGEGPSRFLLRMGSARASKVPMRAGEYEAPVCAPHRRW